MRVEQTRALRLAGAVVVALALVGCQDDEPQDPEPEATHTVDVDAGVAFSIDVPESWEARDAQTSSCGLLTQQVGDLTVLSVPVGCESDGDIGNGNHGDFASVSDAPEAENLEDVTTAIGPGTAFTQEYYECTQECETYDDPWVVVELTSPADAEHPTLSLRGPKDLPLSELVVIAESITAP